MTATLSRQFVSRSWTDWSCSVRVSVTDPSAADAAESLVRGIMREVELAASRFLPESELSRANWLAGVPMPISQTLTRLVGAALDAAADTGGALDPTVGLDLAALGYDRDISLVPGPGVVRPATAPRPDWTLVRLDRDAGLLRVPRHTALDLGATAKAQTADAAAAAVQRRLHTAALVEIGGDLAVAGAPDGGWRVHVAERAGGPGEDIGVHAGGVTTSTTTLRRWQLDGRACHHIVDPATGRPADGPWRTVTVAAPTALAANVASTAAIVLGADAVEFLTDRHVAARLVDGAGVVHYVGHWPQSAPAPLAA